MELYEFEKIRQEYMKFPSSGVEFHNVDSDFLPDVNYRCIDINKYMAYFQETQKIVAKLHTNVHQCFFAIINGSKFVAPHRNKDKHDNSLRTHYGIIVHENDDGILNVGKKQFKWKENKCFTFDTKQLHSVYKSKHYKRVILIVDH